MRSGSSGLAALALVLLAARAAPGFEGFGALTPGGSGAKLVEVTSLADSGPGTLREALRKAGSRRIEFRVGGTIRLEERLRVSGLGFVTIDGSTAPAPGITLEGDELFVHDSHDVVITHLRSRRSQNDGITIKGSTNVVVDHCSLTDSGDENLSITQDSRLVTVSWCLIGDTRPLSELRKAKGMLVASFGDRRVTDVTIHHNLFVNESQRSPQISTDGLFDLRNNVIRNWGSYGVRVRNGARGNIVANVLDSTSNPDRALILFAKPGDLSGEDVPSRPGLEGAGPVYVEGNLGPRGKPLAVTGTAPAPFPVPPVRTDAAVSLEPKVLAGVGAAPRDPIDALLVRSASLTTSRSIPSAPRR